MKANFDAYMKLLARLEGRYSDNPNDRGGATNYGITLGTLKREKDGDLNHDGKIDAADVKLITLPYAAEVYRREYWNAVKGDLLPAPLDYVAFDWCVNSGPLAAIKYMNYTNDWLVLLSYRKHFYDSIVGRDSTQKIFLNGWYNRIARIVAHFSKDENDCKYNLIQVFSSSMPKLDYHGFEGWR